MFFNVPIKKFFNEAAKPITIPKTNKQRNTHFYSWEASVKLVNTVSKTLWFDMNTALLPTLPNTVL